MLGNGHVRFGGGCLETELEVIILQATASGTYPTLNLGATLTLIVLLTFFTEKQSI